MSEFEKLIRARMYIHKLANGIDPISNTCIEQDSILNNIRISRCFFYVVEVLDQLIANSGVIGKNKTSIPFFITEEQKAKILPIERKVLVGQITDKINAVTAENNCKKFNAVWITNWLLEHGYLEIKRDARGHNKRFATLKGYEIGIAVESRNGRYGVFNVNTYNENAQKFIVDNLDLIIRHAQEPKLKITNTQANSPQTSAEKVWTEAQDITLLDLYNKDVPLYEIAVTFKCSIDEVKNRLRTLGVDIRE